VTVKVNNIDNLWVTECVTVKVNNIDNQFVAGRIAAKSLRLSVSLLK
jgi:NCAIR mutase (PurE)-related protein